jgi:glycosyltransferase involved in cell wall biosynthesis
LQSLWLVIPAYRRYDVTKIAFPQLRRCLNELHDRHGIDGQAVVIADDANIDLAHEHRFHALRQRNQPLGRKWNDGYEYAAEHGADFFVPCGTDDWLDPDYLAEIPRPNEIRASRWATSIREDGRRMLQFYIDYEGGDGIRIIPRDLLKPTGFRPAEDHRQRAIDTSVWQTLRRKSRGFRFVYSTDPLNIVQFQSTAPQLNAYAALKRRFRHHETERPFDALRERYPDDLVALAERRYA